MENLRILLAALAALTLVFSVVSSVSPNYLAGLKAYAEDDEEGDNNNNSDSSNSSSDEQQNQTENRHKEHRYEAEGSSRVKLEIENDGIQIGVEVADLNMTNGMYNATFICEHPVFSVTLDNALQVDNGEGRLKADIALANDTYSGCELVVTDTGKVIASFDSFTVQQQAVDDDDVKEKRKERMERIASTETGSKVHERHLNANPSSPGDYAPNWNYKLTANGTATNNETSADSAVNIDMAVWKSSRALILFDVLGGTADVGNHTYTVILGYGIYSVHHEAMKIASLAVDEDGNVVKLHLRGSALEDSEFPKESGSIDMMFEGSTGAWNNRLGDWKLELEGTVAA